MKHTIYIAALLIAIGVLYAGSNYIQRGTLTRNCIYTENRLPIPEGLPKGKVVVSRYTYLATGPDKELICLKDLGSIEREIVGAWVINNSSIGPGAYTKRGSLELLEKGTTYSIVGAIAVTKHGLSTFDSGKGPIYYLVLEDENKVTYQIGVPLLGINDQDLFLSFVEDNVDPNPSVIKMLDPSSFYGTRDPEENSLTYTGKLVELPAPTTE